MALASRDWLEVAKIIIALLMTCVGGWWTYTTYHEDERKHELDTLIDLGNAIAGMHVSCKSSFGRLADLAGAEAGSREGRCYGYFQDAHRISLASTITVKRPGRVSAGQWAEDWDLLQNAIATAGTEKYQFDAIDQAWANILVAKKLKEIPAGGN